MLSHCQQVHRKYAPWHVAREEGGKARQRRQPLRETSLRQR
jgi:hypothetical protein